MKRLFTDHIKRESICLDGIWNFRTDPQNVGKTEKWYLGLTDADISAVPSLWNTEFGLFDYEGASWYQTKFHTKGGTLRFVFEAVMTKADIWLDDTYLVGHYGGYCEFEQIANNVTEGWHTLTICADNSFDATSIPQKAVDWYHYGGVPRSVFVEYLHGICVLENHIDYTLSADFSKADTVCTLELYNAENTSVTAPLKVTVGDTMLFEDNITLSANEKIILKTPATEITDIKLWDVEKPNLYDMVAETDTDDLIDRVGFRFVEVKNQQLLLNGHPVEMLGVNRHEDHPELGQSFPAALMKRDIDIIKNLGCNSIRGSHYPNSRLFVDMLDAAGILFWSEIPIWGGGFSEEALGDPIVVGRGLDMHREMVKYYYNHPCIVLWGMHNEIMVDTQAAYEMSKSYYNFLKENGGNRIVTYATDKPTIDICLEFCDIICINKYHGWYGGTKADWMNFMEEFRALRAELGFEEKPVIMSEFGAAALYGNHTFDNIRWTEEYQADLLAFCLQLFHKDPMVIGMYIWQYCDIRATKDLGRARGFNNKGIVNEYRKPKQAYYTVKQEYDAYRKESLNK